MLISLNLLKSYLEIKEEPKELARILTMLGHEVKEIKNYRKMFESFVIGQILELDRHPNADKLTLCKVNIGNEVLQIVCGANNHKQGDKVVVATINSILPNGLVIKKAKIRNVESQGMLCSEAELGLKAESSGILILSNEAEIGKTLSLYLFNDDIVFELELTPNRGDCFSHLGIARELAAFYNSSIKVKNFPYNEDNNEIIEIVNKSKDCKSYYGKVVKNIKIDSSPLWMKQYFNSLNMKSINSIVDISNFIMMMEGHPIHIFDLDKIEGKIIVRDAHEDEKLLTLDDKEIILTSKDLVIADDKKALALAGIIGGKESAISSNTKNIFIEIANFSAEKIRETSRRLGISTESSKRFERGVNPLDNEAVLKITLASIQKIGNSSISKKTSIYEEKYREIAFDIDLNKANALLGINMSIEQASKILKNLNLYQSSEKNILRIKVPSYRFDISREADIYEELVRMYGYDKVISSTPKIDIKVNNIDKIFIQQERIKNILSILGLNEVINYSFIPKTDKFFEGENVEIKNPLNEEFRVLRNSLIYSLFQNAKYNLNNGISSIKIFEISKTLKLEEENLKVAIALAGKKSKDIFNEEKEYDFFDLKEIIQKFSKMLGANLEFIQSSIKDFHPYKAANILYNGNTIGVIGEIHPKLTEELRTNVFICEINLNKLFYLVDSKEIYKKISKYPEVVRELSILFDKNVTAKEIIQKANLKNSFVSDVEIVDIYEGSSIEENMKSISLKIKLSKEDGTLEEDEINKTLNEILSLLNKTYGANLRWHSNKI